MKGNDVVEEARCRGDLSVLSGEVMPPLELE